MTNINVFKEIKIGSHIRQEINAGGKFVVYWFESIIVNFKGGKELTNRVLAVLSKFAQAT